MSDFVAAIGLVLVIEGLAFAAFPAATRRALTVLFETPETQLRTVGILSAVLGVVIVWVVRG